MNGDEIPRSVSNSTYATHVSKGFRRKSLVFHKSLRSQKSYEDLEGSWNSSDFPSGGSLRERPNLPLSVLCFVEGKIFIAHEKEKKKEEKKKRKEKEGIVEKSGIKEWKLDELRSLSTRDYGHVQQKFHLANLEIAALMEILYPRLVDRV